RLGAPGRRAGRRAARCDLPGRRRLPRRGGRIGLAASAREKAVASSRPHHPDQYKPWRARASLVSIEEMSTALAKTMTTEKTPTAEPKATVSAAEMGARQREISVSEFFTKNRHLLGFDNPRKALLTCVKEAVDNALDAAEEAGILPDVVVKVEVAPGNGAAPAASQATRFRVTVTDNGPGIVRQQIPPIFAKLLYGSKFHRL